MNSAETYYRLGEKERELREIVVEQVGDEMQIPDEGIGINLGVLRREAEELARRQAWRILLEQTPPNTPKARARRFTRERFGPPPWY